MDMYKDTAAVKAVQALVTVGVTLKSGGEVGQARNNSDTISQDIRARCLTFIARSFAADDPEAPSNDRWLVSSGCHAVQSVFPTAVVISEWQEYTMVFAMYSGCTAAAACPTITAAACNSWVVPLPAELKPSALAHVAVATPEQAGDVQAGSGLGLEHRSERAFAAYD
jgi:hypothetical protein